MIKIALTKRQSEFDKKIETTENTFYGGAKGGGKSHGLRVIMVKRRLEQPNSYGVIFRKTYPELYNNHIAPLLTKFPILKTIYNQGTKEMKFPNGSVLAFRHCQYERDLSLHQGQEYHDLAIEEAGEWPEDWFWTLKGSNRSSNPDIKPRTLLTGNPGGIGHKWLKRLFVQRNFRVGIENPKDFAFIPATLFDNPALLESDPGYLNRLKSNKNENLVKAYVEGSWDIAAGSYFDSLDRNIHIVNDFEIPTHWRKFAGFDTGYRHPAAFIWGVTDEDGTSYIYRELLLNGLRSEQLVEKILSYPDSHTLSAIPAGKDCWTKHDGAPSVFEKFIVASNGKLTLIPAVTDRIPGASQLRDYLAPKEYEGRLRPKLLFFKSCPMVYDCLTRMTHDDKNVEDVLKVDADENDIQSGDDLYDCLRYAMMNRPRITKALPLPTRKKWFKDKPTIPGWTTV